MKKQHFSNEHGEITINGYKMSWQMKRCGSASFFGIRGSRIFWLELKKDGKLIGKYDRGWDISCKPDKDDEEASLCISYLVDKYGKDSPKKKKKETGFQE